LKAERTKSNVLVFIGEHPEEWPVLDELERMVNTHGAARVLACLTQLEDEQNISKMLAELLRFIDGNITRPLERAAREQRKRRGLVHRLINHENKESNGNV
jgi:hypothetical protein